MSTSKKRINVTLPKETVIFLQHIAVRDEVPPATKAAQLIERALEIEEDEYFSKLAEQRDTPDATFFSHEEFWNGVLN